MQKILLTLLTLLTLLPLAGDALDLTPTPGFRNLEGFKIPIVHFADGADKVAFQPPAGWSISGGKNLVTLYPKDRADVLTEFRLSALKPHDPNTPERLEGCCLTLLPKDAINAEIHGETLSPFTLRAHPSREFTFTYATQGRRFITSVAVVDLNPRERLTIVTTARAGDFKTARDEVIRSLFTMNWGE